MRIVGKLTALHRVAVRAIRYGGSVVAASRPMAERAVRQARSYVGPRGEVCVHCLVTTSTERGFTDVLPPFVVAGRCLAVKHVVLRDGVDGGNQTNGENRKYK